MKTGAREPAGAAPGRQGDLDSFHHLTGDSLAGKLCSGTACFIARHLNPGRWAAAERQEPQVHCLGQCFAGPAVMDPALRPRTGCSSPRPVVLRRLLKGGARSLVAYQLMGGYRALEQASCQSPEALVGTLEASGLRGRGGAGFPVGRKWRAAARHSAGEKYLIANADEGDPGAYIDRFLLEDDPHAVIEGMLIAARAIGATRGWVYLRCEYPAARTALETALGEARQAGLLGDQATGAGHGFDIGLHVGGGSYICGEETALIRSLEGKRPEVVARPPYATDHGLNGRPTVVNNVETLVNVPWIIEHGAGNYRFLGFSESRGTKVMSLNSLFRRPGLYEVEFGVTLRHIVEELGGGLRDGLELKGVIVGGPLAGIVPPRLLDTRLGFEELRAIGASVGHGGVVAFDQHTSIPALLGQVFSFGADESCGKCTPCRLGSRRLARLLSARPGPGRPNALEEREGERIVSALKLASLCGLGTGLAELAESAWRHYGKELQACPR